MNWEIDINHTIMRKTMQKVAREWFVAVGQGTDKTLFSWPAGMSYFGNVR
jgi:hypothetical protein